VLELGRVFGEQTLVEVAARFDDLLLDARLLGPGFPGKDLIRLADQ
jgi:hypothetical protein